MLKEKLVNTPLLRHADATKTFHVILYVNKWALGATVCQDHDGILHPVRFVSRVFKDAEIRYTPAEKEVLALLRVFDECFHYLAGRSIVVYARHSALKWIYTCKSLTGRVVQWAAMLSPWSFTVVRGDKTPYGLTSILAASIAPPEYVDENLADITPKRVEGITDALPVPSLQPGESRLVLSFDGGVKQKEPKAGAFAAILWKAPTWEVIDARYGYKEGLTVNDCEYHALMLGLVILSELKIQDAIICGDSRIVLGQMRGDLRCNQASLLVWKNKAMEMTESLGRVQFYHVLRKFNQSADYLAQKGMSKRYEGTPTDEEVGHLMSLNTLPALLYGTCEEDNVDEVPLVSAIRRVTHRSGTPRAAFGLGHTPETQTLRPESQTCVTSQPDLVRTLDVEPQVFATENRPTSLSLDEDQSHACDSNQHIDEPSSDEIVFAQEERIRRIKEHQDCEEWIIEMKSFLRGDIEEMRKDRIRVLSKQAELYAQAANGLLYYVKHNRSDQRAGEMKLVVPRTMRKDVLHACHCEESCGAHQGIGKTYARLRESYHWNGMYADTEAYIKACSDCATGKGKPAFEGLTPGNLRATRPFQCVAMDFAVALPESHNGNTMLLLFTCLFTGYMILIPMAGDADAGAVASVYLQYVYRRFGAQEMIRHDRDPKFMASVFKAFNRMLGQKQRATLAYRPQANGKQERNVQTVIRCLRCYIEDADQRDWDEYMHSLEFALNTSFSFVLKQTSFYLTHGWHPRTKLDAMVPPIDGSRKEVEAHKWRLSVCREHGYAMAHAADIQKKIMEDRAARHNERVRDSAAATTRMEYDRGDQVWVYFEAITPGLKKKLAHKWHGPFTILERVSPAIYKLDVVRENRRIFPLLHIARLKLYVGEFDRPSMELREPPPIDLDEAILPEDSWEPDEEHDEYEVEEIIDMRHIRVTRSARRRREYLVKWKGYEETSWVKEEDMACGRLLFEFDERRKQQNRLNSMPHVSEDEVCL
jgi:ribonuclease HI